MDPSSKSRRRFLGLAAIGSATSIAGCSDILGGPSATDGETGTDGDATRQITVLVSPSQEALMDVRSQIGQEIQDGNMTQAEVQQRFAEEQRRLTREAVADLEPSITDRGLTIDERRAGQGALLVSGPATGLIDLLSLDRIRGLVGSTQFQELATPTPTPSQG